MRACAGAMSLSCVCACHRSLTRPCASRLLQGPAVCLSLLSRVDSPMEAVSLLVVSQSCDAFSQSGLYSNHQDIAPRYAGVLLGMSNTAGVLAGVVDRGARHHPRSGHSHLTRGMGKRKSAQVLTLDELGGAASKKVGFIRTDAKALQEQPTSPHA